MIQSLKKYLFTFIVAGLIFIFIPIPTNAEPIDNFNTFFAASQQKTISNYEKSQPSSIDNPVVDPNFNVMRSEDTSRSTATYIVIGLLIAATIIPSILIVPINNKAFILIGGWSTKCFTKSDEKWINNWARKLNNIFLKNNI